MTPYFVSYVITSGGNAPARNGWDEVPFFGPITGRDDLKDMAVVMTKALVDKGWAVPGDHIVVLNWRRFEAAE